MSDKILKNILYAEDEADIREIAKIALEDLGGFSVTYCINGRDLLEKSKTTQPDLILLDVMMPEMDGPTTLLEIRKQPNYEKIPAIFMTAKIQTDEIAEYKNLGVLEVIVKPFDPITLSDIIKKAWNKNHG